MLLQLLVSCAGKELQKVFELVFRGRRIDFICRQMRALNKGGVRVQDALVALPYAHSLS